MNKTRAESKLVADDNSSSSAPLAVNIGCHGLKLEVINRFKCT